MITVKIHQIYECKLTPESLTSGLLNLKKFQNIILLNAKVKQDFYTIRINKIDSYNISKDYYDGFNLILSLNSLFSQSIFSQSVRGLAR